jgi:diguanylate cyclase (GGDEF)-like protein
MEEQSTPNRDPDHADSLAARQAFERELAQHARQHGTVADLGQIALRERDLRTLLDEVVGAVAETLDVQLCGVLKLRADEEILDMISMVGMRTQELQSLPAGRGTQAGYALRTREPVVAEDLREETRFDPRSLLEQGVVSGMNAVIEGHERPFGVLTAHSAHQRSFSPDDVNFLVAVANVLSAAVERHRKEEITRHAALHDPLTGLPNRALVLDRLDLALARRRRDGIDVAMLMLDLDRFKIINDSLGHAAGDDLLLALASRLRGSMRPSDTVGRLSGDEFVVVCERPAGVRHVVALAERIGEAVSRPFELASGEHFLTASIGIAMAEGAEDTSSSLLRDADAAMYRAKQRGPGRYEVFDATVRAQVLARLRTETELRQALDEGLLRVHYQPIMELSRGKPVAVEALVRWEHPRRGLVPPQDFVQIAEETGLIFELGRHVLEAACEQAASWQRSLGCPLRMFVNVSGHQLANPLFPLEVADIAAASGMLAGTLGLEVTESVLIDEAGGSMTVLSELDSRGVRLVLDDFGTGYSSLSYLRRFPLDGVKVDRSFTDGIDGSRQDAAIMKAILEMCRALGLTVIAEGVESEGQLRQLQALGCEHAQGFLLCHPQPAESIGEFLARRLSDAARTAARGVGSPS